MDNDDELQFHEQKFFWAIVDAVIFLNHQNGVRIDAAEDMLHGTVRHVCWDYDRILSDYRGRLTKAKRRKFHN